MKRRCECQVFHDEQHGTWCQEIAVVLYGDKWLCAVCHEVRLKMEAAVLQDPRLDATPRLTVEPPAGLFSRISRWLFGHHQTAPLDPERHHKNHPIKSERDNG